MRHKKMTISKKEFEVLKGLENKHEWVLPGYNDTNNYHGLNRQEHLEELKKVETILKKIYPAFTKINNLVYNKQQELIIRHQAFYGEENGFIGVVYTPLKEVLEAVDIL